jgi:hypothetical protein
MTCTRARGARRDPSTPSTPGGFTGSTGSTGVGPLSVHARARAREAVGLEGLRMFELVAHRELGVYAADLERPRERHRPRRKTGRRRPRRSS